MFENRRWLIIPTNITGSINLNEILNNNLDSLTISNDGTKTFIKYDISVRNENEEMTVFNVHNNTTETITISAGIYGRPSFYSEEYLECTHEMILSLLETPEWKKETNFDKI